MPHLAPAKRAASEDNLAVIILAAGLAHGVKKHGSPSLLAAPGGKTLILQQIETIVAEFPHADIVVVTGYQADKVHAILPDFVRVAENEHYEDTNAARSAGMALRVFPCARRALIIHGDMCFDRECLRQLASAESAILVTENLAEDVVGVNCPHGRVTSFAFGQTPKWAQVAFLAGGAFAEFRKLCYNRKNDKLFTFEILNRLVESGHAIQSHHIISKKLLEINTPNATKRTSPSAITTARN